MDDIDRKGMRPSRAATNRKTEYLSEMVKMWPTPQEDDSSNVNPSEKRRMTLAKAIKQWPTPTGKENQHCPSMQTRGIACRNMHDAKQGQEGQLNPDWVEWLMNWPIGWTSLEPLKELIWLSWEIDPAETDCRPMWTTPGAGDLYSKTNRPRKSREHIGIKSEYLSRQSIEWPGTGPIPRIATNIPDRVNRLKAIGNGQVPAVVKVAWEWLSAGSVPEKSKVTT